MNKRFRGNNRNSSMNESIRKPGCPIASKRIQAEEAGSDVIIYDSEAKLFHVLNDTSFIILKACDGSNSIKDIVIIVSEKFNFSDLDSITNDVTETINQFREKGLIEL